MSEAAIARDNQGMNSATDFFETVAPQDGFQLAGSDKLKFVSSLFDKISPTYNFVNHLISLGQTSLWRLLAFSNLRAALAPHARVLDVGCGPGNLTGFLARQYPDLSLSVTGVDCSEKMLDEARKTYPGERFEYADACALPFNTGTYDVVTTSYTLRNFSDLPRALEEMVRVLKAGGRLYILDAFPIDGSTLVGRVFRPLLYIWLSYIVPVVASLFTTSKAYKYLAYSIQGTVSANEVSRHLRALGCNSVETRYYSLGAAARISCMKSQ
mmetsp:Transcript_13244/g.48239  ORF Transcript_13244/g.48239 Transcript_13244/m.48239 type:complete len:269 (-) Transcript_13244:1962-2768(-)|eukprot:scaffold2631_cov412-Prasinococcus_capsulatus_cf.AAC.12